MSLKNFGGLLYLSLETAFFIFPKRGTNNFEKIFSASRHVRTSYLAHLTSLRAKKMIFNSMSPCLPRGFQSALYSPHQELAILTLIPLFYITLFSPHQESAILILVSIFFTTLFSPHTSPRIRYPHPHILYHTVQPAPRIRAYTY